MTNTKTLRPLLKEVYLGTLTGVFISLWEFFRNTLRLLKTLFVAFFRPTYISPAAVDEGRYLSMPMASRITFEVFILFHVVTIFFLKLNRLKPLNNETMDVIGDEIAGVLMEIFYQAVYALSYFPGLVLMVLIERLWLKLTRNWGHRQAVETHLIYSYNALFLLFAFFGFALRFALDTITVKEQTETRDGIAAVAVLVCLLHTLFLLWQLKKGMTLNRATRLLSVLLLAFLLTVIFTSTVMLVLTVSVSI